MWPYYKRIVGTWKVVHVCQVDARFIITCPFDAFLVNCGFWRHWMSKEQSYFWMTVTCIIPFLHISVGESEGTKED